ncbi:MAG: amidophosphoribosyltransferase, partial [Pseudomonadota bacterium]
ASAAPAVKYPNVYGIDMPTREELIAYQREVDDICRAIAADRLIYQDVDDLIAAVRGDSEIDQFETCCFTGQYVTGDVDDQYLEALRNRRKDGDQAREREESVDIH